MDADLVLSLYLSLLICLSFSNFEKDRNDLVFLILLSLSSSVLFFS